MASTPVTFVFIDVEFLLYSFANESVNVSIETTPFHYSKA